MRGGGYQLENVQTSDDQVVIQKSGAKVMLCIPVNDVHPKHTPHVMQFYAENRHRHDMSLHWQLKQPLHKVQKMAVEVAEQMGCTHVLFTEHDQWGYPVDGLDVLLEQDKDVIGLMTYMRNYPYLPMCMKKNDPSISLLTRERNLRSFYPGDALAKTDLLTWGFTLVKMDVFARMKAADLNPWVWGLVPTDSYFCQYCEDLDIERWCCSAYVVNHGDLPKEHVVFYRRMFDALHSAHGRHPIGTLPTDKTPPPDAQNEEDEHGVMPYKDQLTELMEDAEQLDLAQKAAEQFGQVPLPHQDPMVTDGT